MTVVVLTPNRSAPTTKRCSARSSAASPPGAPARTVPLGLLRVNLGQEALAFALMPGPAGLFAEPEALADALSHHFRRFVPLMGL